MASWSLGDIWCVEAAGGEFCRGKNQKFRDIFYFLFLNNPLTHFSTISSWCSRLQVESGVAAAG